MWKDSSYCWVVLCKNHVRRDMFGKEYVYKPSEVLRIEKELPDVFIRHPLF